MAFTLRITRKACGQACTSLPHSYLVEQILYSSSIRTTTVLNPRSLTTNNIMRNEGDELNKQYLDPCGLRTCHVQMMANTRLECQRRAAVLAFTLARSNTESTFESIGRLRTTKLRCGSCRRGQRLHDFVKTRTPPTPNPDYFHERSRQPWASLYTALEKSAVVGYSDSMLVTAFRAGPLVHKVQVTRLLVGLSRQDEHSACRASMTVFVVLLHYAAAISRPTTCERVSTRAWREGKGARVTYMRNPWALPVRPEPLGWYRLVA